MLTKQEVAELLGVTVRTLFVLYPGGENRRTVREGQDSLGPDVRRRRVTRLQNYAGDEEV